MAGSLLFGIATWRARVLPRRAAALFVIGLGLAAGFSCVALTVGLAVGAGR